ncbi:hypothetical protein [Plantibacter sp. YIM 135249]|uniref:hypothetical protein n=1 Tax=Plantibacter sp. YIM 135249 TaxID=3423918 RepID=UPI003D35612F
MSISEIEETEIVVSLKLDESLVVVCLTHVRCKYAGRATAQADCDRRWIYGVAAVAYETLQDLHDLRASLNLIRNSILLRSGIESSRRISDFKTRGWHATDDGPEFSEPLLAALDSNSSFKGHVRFAISDEMLDSTLSLAMYDFLFVRLLSSVLNRYREFGKIDVVFEDDQSPLSRYEGLVQAAHPLTDHVTVHTEGKGDPALAVADYLLYASLKFVGSTLQHCQVTNCLTQHDLPMADDIEYDKDGRFTVMGHLTARDYSFRVYSSFVRAMSSAVQLHGFIRSLAAE